MDLFANKLISDGNTSVSNLLLRHYRELGMSNTEFLLYLQIKSFSDQGNAFPSAHSIATSLGLADNQIYQELHNMIAKHLMQIDTVQNQGGLAQDSYDFTQLYEKLAQSVLNSETKQVQTQNGSDREAIFNQIEKEFGRPLSPIELEMISGWLDKDHYSAQLIQLALKEAVLSQVYNLKYIDRILIAWEKKNLKTPEQVQNDREHHQQVATGRAGKRPSKRDLKDIPDIPMFKIGDEPKSS